YYIDFFRSALPSVHNDFLSYKEIVKCPELKSMVPRFYYPPLSHGDDYVDVIIMDYIVGEWHQEMRLESEIYKTIIKNGFKITDSLEYITEKETGRIVVVDLGGIRKDHENI